MRLTGLSFRSESLLGNTAAITQPLMVCIYSAVYKLYFFFYLIISTLRAGNTSFSSLSSSICLSIRPFTGHLSVYVMNLGMDIIFSPRDLKVHLGQRFPIAAACRNQLDCWLHSQEAFLILLEGGLGSAIDTLSGRSNTCLHVGGRVMNEMESNLNMSRKMPYGVLSVILLCYRITCVWFCNKKEMLFVLDPVYF